MASQVCYTSGQFRYRSNSIGKIRNGKFPKNLLSYVYYNFRKIVYSNSLAPYAAQQWRVKGTTGFLKCGEQSGSVL